MAADILLLGNAFAIMRAPTASNGLAVEEKSLGDPSQSADVRWRIENGHRVLV